jgi:hypothetical protein
MTEKLTKGFYCEVCDYKCSKNSDFQKHLLTKKHTTKFNESLGYESDNNSNKNNKKVYTCNCGKVYKFRQGLSYHKKSCGNLPTKKEKKVYNIKDYVDKFDALENQIKELQLQNDKQFKLIFDILQTKFSNTNS